MTSEQTREKAFRLRDIFQPGFTFSLRESSGDIPVGRIVMIREVDETRNGQAEQGRVFFFGGGSMRGDVAIRSLQQIVAYTEA